MRSLLQISTGALLAATALFALAAPAAADPASAANAKAELLFEPLKFEALRFDPIAALQGEGDLQSPADSGAAAVVTGFNDLMSTVYDISSNSVEVRIGAMIWSANIDKMEAMSIQKDMKAARANGFIDITQATTRDFEKDFGMDLDPQVIVNPFVDWRIHNNVFRFSWWQYSTDGSRTITEMTAFGDQTYDPGTPIEGDMTLWDAKVGYEYRVLNNDYGQIFTGISLVYLRSAAKFEWKDNVFGFDSDGCPIDSVNCIPGTETPGKAAGDDTPFEHFGLAALSVRIEAKLTEGVYLWLDSQSMAIPFVGGIAYAYTDTKFGASIEITRFVRVSAGYRYYDAKAQLDDFGSKETDLYARFKLDGVFGMLTVVFP